MQLLRKLQALLNGLIMYLPDSVVVLLCRVAIASVFWRSVQTKISGWEVAGQSLKFFNLSPSTFTLFQYEYNLPVLPYKLAAYAATFAEFFFSLLLVLGLATRFSALGLLAVTAVIQFLVYPDSWPVHILWFALLVYILKQGGGKISVDYLISKTGKST